MVKWPVCRKPQLPMTRKCCFCVPIRKGVIIFAYINLVLSLLSLPLLIFLLVAEISTGDALKKREHVEPLIYLPLSIAFVLIDLLMVIVLLIGVHKKKRSLLKVYFYFGVVCQLLTLCLDLAYFDYQQYLDNTVFIFFLSLNIYLLFLVFNTMYVIEENAGVQYVVYREQ